MRRFLPKFCLLFVLFGGFLGYYWYHVQPNISGDLGRMGKIPFGKLYSNYHVVGYEKDYDNAVVEQVFVPDSCGVYSILTIGDSFSRFHGNGYQMKLSALSRQTIGNASLTLQNPIQSFVSLMNAGFLPSGQTVVVENVERTLIDHLNGIDFESPNGFAFLDRKRETQDDETCLLGLFSWIRLRLGFENPVTSFSLKKACFSHPRYASTLFILNERQYQDGDLFWTKYTKKDFEKARENLMRIDSLATLHGIRFYFLIAPDKYDVYEPWIKGNHADNPTLGYFEDEGWILNPKSFLRQLIEEDVKEVYMCNDTHWSEKGADLVADYIYRRMALASEDPDDDNK